MSVLARLLQYLSRDRAAVGPELVDVLGDPGTDTRVPTEKAVRDAIAASAADTIEILYEIVSVQGALLLEDGAVLLLEEGGDFELEIA